MNRKKITLLVAVIMILLGGSPSAFAESLAVAVNKSVLLPFGTIERVAIANPDIADVAVAGNEVIVVGKSPGITTLHVWTALGRTTYDIEVGADDRMLESTLEKVLNQSGIKVSKVGKTVILEGKTRDQQKRSWAEKIAAAYGDKVINLIELTNPRQVKIEAQIIEIFRDKTDELGITWGNNKDGSNPGSFSFGQSAVNSRDSNAFRKLGTYAEINGVVQALVKNGFAKILSRPNVTTMSGEKATILVGGEIPVPVAVDNNKVTIEWKEYGIKLAIAPEAGEQGLITTKVSAEVSTIDYASSNKVDIGSGIVVPPLKSRKSETMIALPSGQVMAIGGLIGSEETKSISKVPLLAELPVIGHLFRSTSFTSGKTEVVILITPTIVDASEAPVVSAAMQEFMADGKRQ